MSQLLKAHTHTITQHNTIDPNNPNKPNTPNHPDDPNSFNKPNNPNNPNLVPDMFLMAKLEVGEKWMLNCAAKFRVSNSFRYSANT